MKIALLCLALAVPAFSADAPTNAYKTDDERTVYTVGYLMGKNVATFNLKPAEIKVLQAGLSDSVTGKAAAVDVATYQPQINEMLQKRMSVGADAEKAKGKAYAEKFVADNKPLPITGGGWYQELKAGTGASPLATDTVRVHYLGTTTEGVKFDSSYDRNQPTEFPLDRVIPCWTRGITLMKVGGKGKLVCPSDVAYGDQGRPGIKPGATLVFEVELLDVVKPPADAKKKK
jgi:FKBP-type peptidyl-prolyl cis-trans isomerase